MLRAAPAAGQSGDRTARGLAQLTKYCVHSSAGLSLSGSGAAEDAARVDVVGLDRLEPVAREQLELMGSQLRNSAARWNQVPEGGTLEMTWRL